VEHVGQLRVHELRGTELAVVVNPSGIRHVATATRRDGNADGAAERSSGTPAAQRGARRSRRPWRASQRDRFADLAADARTRIETPNEITFDAIGAARAVISRRPRATTRMLDCADETAESTFDPFARATVDHGLS